MKGLLLPPALRNLERHWLLNHPVLWIMRVPRVVYYGLIVVAVLCLIALVLPVDPSSVLSLKKYFLSALALLGLLLGPWFYGQVRSAPQLREIAKPRIGLFLMAGYTLILVTALAVVYTFVGILGSRIADTVDPEELERDALLLRGLFPGGPPAQNGVGGTELDAPVFDLRPFLDVTDGERSQEVDRIDTVIVLSPLFLDDQIRGLADSGLIDLDEDVPREFITLWRHEARRLEKYGFTEVYEDIDSWRDLASLSGFALWDVEQAIGIMQRLHRGDSLYALRKPDALVSMVAVLAMVILLRVFQSTGGWSLFATVVLAVGLWIGLGLYVSAAPSGSTEGTVLSVLILVVLVAGNITSFGVLYLKGRSILFGVGVNLFFLLLPTVPTLFLMAAEELGALHWEGTTMGLWQPLALGLGLVLLLSPWIESRYIALRSKPA